RNNPETEVIPFETSVVSTTRLKLNPKDAIMTNAQKLAGIGGGGTNCSATLELLNSQNAKGDVCIYVSDNESWLDSGSSHYSRGTQTMVEWEKFKRRNPLAKLVCIDLTPTRTQQT